MAKEHIANQAKRVTTLASAPFKAFGSAIPALTIVDEV